MEVEQLIIWIAGHGAERFWKATRTVTRKVFDNHIAGQGFLSCRPASAPWSRKSFGEKSDILSTLLLNHWLSQESLAFFLGPVPCLSLCHLLTLFPAQHRSDSFHAHKHSSRGAGGRSGGDLWSGTCTVQYILRPASRDST